MQRLIAASCTAGALAAAALPAAAGAKKPFSGNICAIPVSGLLSAAHITEPCIRGKTHKIAPKPSPLGGTVGQVISTAHWGLPHGVNGPSHYLLVSATKVIGSGNALAVAKKILRDKVIEHGAPVAVGSPGSLLTDTASCVNPPTEDCTSGSVVAIVGSYYMLVQLEDAPPTISGAEPSPGEDTPQDDEQEATVKAPVTAIAKAIAAKL
jgi:hypothetical protein